MPVKKTDHSNVKKINRNVVYRYLYKKEAQSKQDIAYGLHLSLPTVSQNIKELQDMGLVIETGKFESTGGRKAKAIELNYRAKYAVGLDITKSHAGIVLIDLACEVIDFVRFKLAFENHRSYFQEVGRLIAQTINSSKIDTDKILGVGIGVPAIVTEDRQAVTYSPILGFTGGTLDQFAEYIPYPCSLCNDANAAGFAEIYNAPLADNMVYISLSNSVGGAILIDGKICHGSNQRAGEVGHITVHPEGPMCYCGQRGCLDALCNARILSDNMDGNLDLFFERLENDGCFSEVWDEYLDNMALAINSLRMTLDSNIVIGGYVGSHMDKHIESLRQRVARRNTFERDGSYLRECLYKFEATAVGAALYYINWFIENV